MTAIVGTINRRGVAFAADSAATHTISSKHKITNNANKIFELSKFHPVGVCVCGNLDFLGVSWEEIFKMFRYELNNKHYDTLNEYSVAFFKFVREKIMMKLLATQDENFKHIVYSFLQEVKNLSNDALKEAKIEITEKALYSKMQDKFNEFIGIYETYDKCIDFLTYSEDDFIAYSKEIIKQILQDILDSEFCPNNFEKDFTKSLHHIIVSQVHVYFVNTELIFWGYGEKEIFPSYYSYVISTAFDNKIKYTLKSTYNVSNECVACVEPFAQTDVANTVIRGVDDDLRKMFYKTYNESVELLRNEIVAKLEAAGAPDTLTSVLRSFDVGNYTKLYVDGMDNYIQENYISKLVNTISYLSKEDLADMAESLVRMTYLKRRITSEEESVGGPVDVAVITKGDGFIWLKRKHYFSADLNPHYFERSRLNK